jgi:excisionase family DNA binding protein
VLANPVYAGAYVFGRHRLQRVVTPDGSVVTRRVDQPRAQWETLLLGHHAGYISWEEFGANQARVAANRTNRGARPPREGPALCQGMVHCGACGRPMGVRYSHGQPSYECGRSRADHVATPACRSARAATVDHAVAGQLLAALSGEEVTLALAAADEVTRRRASTTRAAELAVERARYQAGRAERALLACEPENRLVARTFETRLEARLRELAEAEAALATARTTTAPLPPRAELEAAVADLAQLWAAPTTADRDRKRLLRTLLADVTLTPDTDPAKLRIGLRWRSGSAEELVVQRSNRVQEARRTNPEAVELVRQLGPLTDNATLASKLNTAGLVTGAGRPFDAAAVGAVRRSYGIASPGLLAPGEATVSDVASRLAVAHSTVIAWIQTGLLTARRDPTNRYLIAFGAQAEAACRARIAAFPWLHAQANTDPPGPHERTPSQIAEQLGISRDAVYNWIQRGYLPARHGPGRHLYVPYTPQVQTACRQRIIDSPQLPATTKTQALQSPTGAAL